MSRNSAPAVRAWEETVTLPTYPVQPADPNPMFLEKRVYQGSSGKVYPNPFIDRVSLEKVDRPYRAIFVENEWLQIMILPEIGGRIHAACDKTNGYDFFYRQHVIKPALVGLLGPWISGGVEFNWPQHHRPSIFMPVHASIEYGADGSATVWLSEHDPMNRMKGMVGIRLCPDKSIVEARLRLSNRTPFTQTFLWWANVAVRVHDQYQAFFPPDVTFVADHARRAISRFPVARNLYYGVDYSSGVDISWYRNIPVPTSYMVTRSKYDFFGGYDHARRAGFVHVANHHLAPGKKLWTWGNAEFGYAWDRNLTDEDGPYVELMAGVFTDNQPDFSWLHPYETRTARQIWYPIQEIGPAVCANEHAALSLTRDEASLLIGLCSPENRQGCRITIQAGDRIILEQTVDLAPGRPWKDQASPAPTEEDLEVRLTTADGTCLLEYRTEKADHDALAEPAQEPPPPAEIASTDELYLTGLHLEQYRHATRLPEPYWEEGLRRDPGEARLNNAMGLVALRRGEFARAEGFFRRAVGRLTRRNANPRDGEPFYNLGMALVWQRRLDEACAAFYKSAWNYTWRSAAYYALAMMAAQRGDFPGVLAHTEESLAADPENLAARDLRASLLRRLGRTAEARSLTEETLRRDPLDFRAQAESALLHATEAQWVAALEGDTQTALDIAFDYAGAGLYADASRLLTLFAAQTGAEYPMIYYSLASFAAAQGQTEEAAKLRRRAAAAPPLHCFPSRLEEMVILEEAIRKAAEDARALYYLGNLYYDRRRYSDAIHCWRRSVALDPGFSIPWRNLGIAEFNVNHDAAAALACYGRARAANPADARLLYEYDQLRKRTNVPPEQRLADLQQHADLLEQRDDLTIEYVSLLILTGEAEQALSILTSRRFSPWEGGEGLVSAQYVHAHAQLGRAAIDAGNYDAAVEHFRAARRYPHNLGEGKHLLTLERHLDYFEGLALDLAGHHSEARACWQAAAEPLSSWSIQNYYQALALRHLGRNHEAEVALHRLIEHARRIMETEPRIDYFATSLPNFLLFEDDLASRNIAESLLSMGFGELGLGSVAKAEILFQRILEIDSSILEARDGLARAAIAAGREGADVRGI